MKDYKVSVRHYLNTTLKPSIIKGKLYYPIYLMINAKRKTSKIKSLVFSSDYTEKEFNSKSDDINKKIALEVDCIEKILRLTVQELKEYNTTFFNAFACFCFDVPFVKIQPNKDIYQWDNLQFTFINKLLLKSENDVLPLTLFDFYCYDIQHFFKEEINKQINEKGLNVTVLEVLNDFNRIVFYDLLEYFIYYLKGNKKTRNLTNIYDLDTLQHNGINNIISKYIK